MALGKPAFALSFRRHARLWRDESARQAGGFIGADGVHSAWAYGAAGGDEPQSYRATEGVRFMGPPSPAASSFARKLPPSLRSFGGTGRRDKPGLKVNAV
jgi:hypothetical protein